jgi:hypothetical protein
MPNSIGYLLDRRIDPRDKEKDHRAEEECEKQKDFETVVAKILSSYFS